ncbi:MAG TPA: adenylate/guanylate cyclase domain-containing protein [Solirubrobacteraceae bacterium]|nr:adenylate/guanylate cyclase domain-containing protein [Solirubrobacteraceae bacterium]
MRRRAWLRRKRLLLAAVTVATVGLGVLAYATGVLYPLEAQSIDVRFGIRGSRPSLVKDFVVVAVDENTFNYFGKLHAKDPSVRYQWPFPRRDHAIVIDHLLAAGARLIAFDVQFTEPTDPVDDDDLIEAIARAHNMVLATDAVTGGQTDVLGGSTTLRRVGARAANSTVINDAGGVLRDMRHSYQGIDTFGVAIASNAAGHEVSPKLFGGAQRAVPIDYAGPPGTVAAIPYWRVYADKFPAAAVKGKIVIVGAEASRLQDIHSTPTSGSQEMDGPEVQANIAATALDGIPLRNGPTWLNVALVVLFGVAAPLSSIRIRVWRVLLASVALAGLFTLATQIAFDNGTIIAYTYPLLTLVLAIIATLAVVLLGEAFERQHARDIFARFVPPDVVDDVLARTDDDFRLGGVERECTVLFTDLRGFTSFSESQPAAKVIEVVNVYLNEMTEAVLDAGGTLISYIGDGILALFGAPVDQPDHADRALVASREMLGPRLTRFNDWLHDQGYEHGFRMGIGLNSGTVMAGNVGSSVRVEYTVIGDPVNTASRLEGLTKGTPHTLFVAETTRDLMHAAPEDLVFVDHLDIRGRVAKMAVYTLSGAIDVPPPTARQPSSERPAAPNQPPTGSS